MEAKSKVTPAKYNYGWVVAMAGFFMHLCLGTLYCWGTLTPYITSYLRQYDPTVTYADSIIVFLMTPLAQFVAMPLGGYIEGKIGPRLCALLGCWIMSGGVFLAAYTTSITGLLMTYCSLFGFGMGIGYMSPIACGMRWLPKSKGAVSGIVITGFGLGGALFNIIGAAICNPHNLSGDPYFGAEVADKVPKMFMVLGTMYAVITSAAALLLRNPTKEEIIALAAARAQEADAEAAKEPLIASDAKKVKDATPLEVVASPIGWLLFAMLLLGTCAGVLVISTYKTYAVSSGYSDATLTIIGAIALGFNGGGRFLYGWLCDNLGYIRALKICFCVQTVLSLFFLSSVDNPYFYTAMVCLMVMNYGGNFSMFPTVTAEIFGTKNVSANYGLIFSGFAAAGISLKIGLMYFSYQHVIYLCTLVTGLAGVGAFVLECSETKTKNI
eukprot:CAMPEP_0167757924 /NCGR_PEP_ID=MMETSP0110_2-20121227/10190_1 /TAXON_ID=629695 /ORGANISM="Gymnochlora sp., Strain CCMP2014" /LENGTH=439 /DNA_ID=CAMNT_0007644157 /DNA_START=22 /DNA_END=1341 /DNA_ORIENTATION=-